MTQSSSVSTFIVDDEAPARELLHTMLTAWPRIRIVGEAGDGESAVAQITTVAPDLVFLDVQMPGMNGFDVVSNIDTNAMPMVVFVTAYDQYALRAFEVSACDYLLKPFDEDRLAVTVQRVLDRLDEREQGNSAAMRSLLEQIRPAAESPIVFKVDGRHVFLGANEVDWIEASGKEARVHIGKSALTVRESMNSIEQRIDPQRFIRVHRSAIVNRACIRELQPYFQGDYVLILKNGTRVTTGRSYREQVQRLTQSSR